MLYVDISLVGVGLHSGLVLMLLARSMYETDDTSE